MIYTMSIFTISNEQRTKRRMWLQCVSVCSFSSVQPLRAQRMTGAAASCYTDLEGMLESSSSSSHPEVTQRVYTHTHMQNGTEVKNSKEVNKVKKKKKR